LIPVYRRGVVHRKVNDERAYYMNGIAGHAGLFSNAHDIAKYAFMLLNGGKVDADSTHQSGNN
jgi:beta-N-acetylhexosaminidase